MGGSSKKQTVGWRYFMALHLAFCHGPIDRLRKVLWGERGAWIGSQTENGTIAIDKPELFGGEKKEGGIHGQAAVMMGGETQTLPTLALLVLPQPSPAFRGVFSLLFDGLIGCNNPYIKPVAAQLERILAGWDGGAPWYPEKAPIPIGTPSDAPIYSPGDVVIAEGATSKWLYLDGNGVGDYSAAGYNDSAWESGPGGFGDRLHPHAVANGFTAPDTIIPAVTGEAPYKTLWVRHHFTMVGAASVRLKVLHDNTRGIWLDGAELAPTAISDFVSYVDVTINPGEHVLALRVVDTGLPGVGNYVACNFIGTVLSELTAGDYLGMNPAHIVYECLTNTEWGLGYPVATIGESFEAAADTLYDEGFGLCMLWNEQEELKAFIQRVVDHCGAAYYADPRTGKFELKLLRADYDPETLPVFDSGNVVAVESFQRAGYGDTVNEITVVYRDVDTNKDTPITVQDLANIQAQGAVVSQTRQYPGIPNASLAARVAQRDLIASATPIAKARLRVNRDGWRLTPGAVLKLVWPDLGIAGVVFRVVDIDYGELTNGEITLTVAEDVFGLPSSSYVEQEPPGWEEPDTSPAPIVRRDIVEVPYRSLVAEMTATDLAALDMDAAYLAVVAARPTQLSQGFDIWNRVGTADFELQGTGGFVPSAMLAADISQADTVLPIEGAIDLGEVEVGELVIIGEGSGAEWAKVQAIDVDAMEISVARGVLDTTPQDHAAGALLFFDDALSASDRIERATGEEVDFKLLTIATGGTLAIEAATEVSRTAAQRQVRPYPPGNLRVNGQAYPSSVFGAPLVQWSHRNRLQQTADIVEQDEGDIGPEPGTSYSGWVYDDDSDALITSAVGISGTSWTPFIPGGRNVRLEVGSVRGGIESWQRQVRRFSSVDGVILLESGENLVTEAGDYVTEEKPTLELPAFTHTLTATFSGTFSAAEIYYVTIGVSGYPATLKTVSAAGKTSFAEMANALAAELMANGPGIGSIEVSGNSVIVKANAPFVTYAVTNVAEIGIEQRQAPYPITAGTVQNSYIDLFRPDGLGYSLAPNTSSAYNATGLASIRLLVKGRTYAAQKAIGITDAGFGADYVIVNWNVILSTTDNRVTQLYPLAQAISDHAELDPYSVSGTLSMVAGMARDAILVQAGGNYDLVQLGDDFQVSHHPSGFKPLLRFLSAGQPTLPAGAKQLSTVLFFKSTPAPISAGSKFEITLDGTTYTYTATGAEAGFEDVCVGLKTLIEAGGLFTVSWFSDLGLIEVERNAVNTAFTISAWASMGSRISFS
ncbi:phage tail protein [Caldimonas sp. KR1-144]|uniref:phage tail protein n=1 Tax=Caldimonas sp. KR1-144 TaxID=3400911 RepID=UPI003C0D7129